MRSGATQALPGRSLAGARSLALVPGSSSDERRLDQLLRPGDQRLPVPRLSGAARRGSGVAGPAHRDVRRHPLRGHQAHPRRPGDVHQRRRQRRRDDREGGQADRSGGGAQGRGGGRAGEDARPAVRTTRAGSRWPRSTPSTRRVTSSCGGCSTTPSGRGGSSSSTRSSRRSPTSCSTPSSTTVSASGSGRWRSLCRCT